MVRVFINGYGNIGRRLASALAADKEIQLVGIAKYSIDEKVKEALENRYNVYVPKESGSALGKRATMLQVQLRTQSSSASSLLMQQRKEPGTTIRRISMSQ